MDSNYIWGGVFVAGIIAEICYIRSKRWNDTFSGRMRVWFRIRESKLGKFAFIASWVGFCIWFLLHILEV